MSCLMILNVPSPRLKRFSYPQTLNPNPHNPKPYLSRLLRLQNTTPQLGQVGHGPTATSPLPCLFLGGHKLQRFSVQGLGLRAWDVRPPPLLCCLFMGGHKAQAISCVRFGLRVWGLGLRAWGSRSGADRRMARPRAPIDILPASMKIRVWE
jgi:hypothetical protein